LVVLALLALLASLASPSWTQMRLRNAVRAAVNDFNQSLYFARSQAVLLNSPVTVCASRDGINCTTGGYHEGWIVRLGPATNSTGQRVLQDVLQKPFVTMLTNVAGGRFTFLPNGAPSSGFAGASVLVCPSIAGYEGLIRRLTISRGGRITPSAFSVCAL
jgi:type IV fimbrial biogenesis protein FimT